MDFFTWSGTDPSGVWAGVGLSEAAPEDEEPTNSSALLASAKSLRNRAGKLLDQGVPEADAAAIRTSLAAIPVAIDARDWNQLRTILDTLSDLLFYLED